MKLLVGLGNTGTKYKNTRHNVGFMVVDYMLSKLSDSPDNKFKKESKFFSEVVYSPNVIIAKPQTFMNDSGKAVSALSSFYKIDQTDIFVVHDDLDIKLGEYKIQKGKGPKVHNGILSIEKELRKTDFWRVRVGVDNREPENRMKGETYVLQKFTEEELKIIENVYKRIFIELTQLISSK